MPSCDNKRVRKSRPCAPILTTRAVLRSPGAGSQVGPASSGKDSVGSAGTRAPVYADESQPGSSRPNSPEMRLLIIEDSKRLQESLKTGFRRAGFAVDVVGDGDRGLIFAKREHYDAIILDLMLPGMDGLQLLHELRASGSDAHVLVLTAKQSVEDRVTVLRAGADDYVPKPFSFDELLARVEALVRRRYASKRPWMQIGSIVIDPAGRRVTVSGNEVVLAKRDFKVLEYLARRKGEVVTRVEIEDHIYGEGNFPGSNVIESAVSTLRKKLRSAGASPADLIQTRHGLGYWLGSPND